MKIGIDIHGVINKFPEFFSEMTRLFYEAGHEVHILTGSTLKPEKEFGKKNLGEIQKRQIYYTHLFSIVDYHESIGTKIVYLDEENPWIDSDVWNQTKANYCQEHKIDIMFDDTKVYGDFFKTPFAHFTAIVPEEKKNILF